MNRRTTVGGASALAAALVVLAWSCRRAKAPGVSPEEERVFRAFNDAPDDVSRSVWTVMQSGSFAAVPVVAVLVGLRRGRTDGALVGAAGTTAWLAGKAIKSVVGRGRPADLLPDVTIRGTPQTGLGYPSGHAAVALTLALASARRPAWRVLGVAGAGVAAGGRLYTGAHLPLDVAGGLAVGVIVGGLAARVRSIAS